jgi:chloramphenicol 3-O phosphotransferase
MEPGNIVLLNGTSSAGKTTTARALQRIMARPYLHTGIDHFLSGLPPQCRTTWIGDDPPSTDYFLLLWKGGPPRFVPRVAAEQPDPGLGDFAGLRIGSGGVELLAGMYRAIAALAASGVDVIVDDVLHDERVLRAAVDALGELPVLFVALRVPLAVAEQREHERGDRGPGGAAVFYDRVHAHGIYDLELDTSVLSPEECALQIKEALEDGSPRQAFRRLRTRFAAQSR